MTIQELSSIMPNALTSNMLRFGDTLNSTMDKYSINTSLRQACFLANIGEESGSLGYTHELWGPTKEQILYERDFTALWPPLTAKDRNWSAFSLGNIMVGDGVKFKGRGLIQNTGRKNYKFLTDHFKIDFINHPDLLEGVVWACEAAGYFWASNKINEIADTGDFDGVCDMVNRGHKTIKEGDSINFKNRLEFFLRAKQIFHLN